MESSTQTVTREDIEGLIRGLLVEEFDIEPDLIRSEATMEELDLDSLDMVEIGQVVEQKYGVRIKASDAEGVSDLGGVIEMIHTKIVSGDTGEDDEDGE
jgi:acyl carrier protein